MPSSIGSLIACPLADSGSRLSQHISGENVMSCLHGGGYTSICPKLRHAAGTWMVSDSQNSVCCGFVNRVFSIALNNGGGNRDRRHVTAAVAESFRGADLE